MKKMLYNYNKNEKTILTFMLILITRHHKYDVYAQCSSYSLH